MIRAGELLQFIPGMMAQRMTRLNQRWVFGLMIDFGMTSPITTSGPDMCV